MIKIILEQIKEEEEAIIKLSERIDTKELDLTITRLREIDPDDFNIELLSTLSYTISAIKEYKRHLKKERRLQERKTA